MTELMLKFKGNRDYIHGTDLFDTIVREVGAEAPMELQLKAVARYQVNLRDQAEVDVKDRVIGFFGQPSGRIALVEDSRRPVTESYTYDEDQVCDGAQVANGCAEVSRKWPYSFIETAVALNKLLMRDQLPSVGEWWFVQVSLSVDPQDTERVGLCARSPLVPRLVVSEVYADGVEIGTIGFAARK